MARAVREPFRILTDEQFLADPGVELTAETRSGERRGRVVVVAMLLGAIGAVAAITVPASQRQTRRAARSGRHLPSASAAVARTSLAPVAAVAAVPRVRTPARDAPVARAARRRWGRTPGRARKVARRIGARAGRPGRTVVARRTDTHASDRAFPVEATPAGSRPAVAAAGAVAAVSRAGEFGFER
jgi:hypothetical protein